jgi:hypothetical protein
MLYGYQWLSPEGSILVRDTIPLGEKGADLLGRPKHRLIHGGRLLLGASLMGATDLEIISKIKGSYLELGGGKHSELSRAGPLSRGAL